MSHKIACFLTIVAVLALTSCSTKHTTTYTVTPDQLAAALQILKIPPCPGQTINLGSAVTTPSGSAIITVVCDAPATVQGVSNE